MIEHALYFSAKGIKAKRRSVQKLIKQGAIRVKEKEVRVTGKPEVSKYQLVDSRNMVKMWSYYIRMNEWQVSFSLLFDDSILDLGFVNYLLGLSGRIVGFGKGCPRLGGPFGKFISTRFESD